MFRQCAGDAAPGSSQTAFGSGSLLLAPLSNFRARDPAYYCVFTAFPQTRDGQSACMSGCSLSISQSLSRFLSLSAFVSLSITLSLSLPVFLPAELAPSSFPCLVLCLQDYRSAVSLTASKSCCTLPLSLVSSLPLSLSLSASL